MALLLLLFIVENIDVSFPSRFCRRSYNGPSFLVANNGVCGEQINERNNADGAFPDAGACNERFNDGGGGGVLSNRGLRSYVSGSVLMVG